MAVLAQPVGELADRRRLARAVDADDEDHARAVVDGQRPRLAEQRLDLAGERGLEVVEIAPLAQPLDELHRRRHAHVCADQRLLERLPRVVVERVEADQPLTDRPSRASERAAEPPEEARGLCLRICLRLGLSEQLTPRSHESARIQAVLPTLTAVAPGRLTK